MKNNILLHLIFGSLLWSCSMDNIDLSKNNKISTSQISDLSVHDIYHTRGLVKFGNTLITISPTNNYNAISVDIQTTQKNRFFRRRFSGGNNMFQVMSLNSYNGQSVTALDFRSGRLIETAITPTLSRVESTPTETIISLPIGQQHLVAAKTTTFVIATGLYSAGRYLYYSLTDNSARYFLSYPDHPEYPELQETTKAMLYASNVLRVRPDASAFVCADMYSGVIDFCKITSSGTIERTKMHRLHLPEADITEIPSTNVEYYRSNRFGFPDVTVSQHHVYALYSGHSYRDMGNSALDGYSLLIYDWEGNLLKECLLDTPLANICYDPNEDALYGISAKQYTSLIKINI